MTPIGSRGRASHGAAGRRRRRLDNGGGDEGGGAGGGGSGIDVRDRGETIFHSPMDSQKEIDRFHIIDNSNNISAVSDPSGMDRGVTSMFCPEDEVRGGGISWGPNEDQGGGNTGKNDPDVVYSQYHVYFQEEIGDITTEPDGNYQRQTVNIDTTDFDVDQNTDNDWWPC